MKPYKLYQYIEREWDLRLSGAEKMLLRQALSDVNPNDSLITGRLVLERFRFDSTSFKDWQKIVNESYQGAISEYEFRGKQRKSSN